MAMKLNKLWASILWISLITQLHAFLPLPHRTPPRRGAELRGSDSSYVATCIPGLSSVLAQELQSFGCRHVEMTGQSAVRFSADLRAAMTALLCARTAHKVMELLCQGSGLRDRDDLAAFVKESVNVKDLLGDGKGGLLTLSVSVVLNNAKHIPSDINHSHYTALGIKNALCDAVRELRGDRPNVDLVEADVPIVAVLVGTAGKQTADISLYRQLHVGSLHRRGYRQGTAIHKAAMKESLAAGLLLIAEWDKKSRSDRDFVLLDPMAGSGTLLLEAAMIAADMAPGLMRIKCGVPGQNMPCVVRWKHSEMDENAEDTWKQLLMEAAGRAKAGIRSLQESSTIRLMGNELHPGALSLMTAALETSGLQFVVRVHGGNCREWSPATDNAMLDPSSTSWLVVSNPPWGERLTDDMHEAWEDLRVFLKGSCTPGTEAWILSGNAAATKHLGLARSASVPLQTGSQNLRWLQYFIRSSEERKTDSLPVVTGRRSERSPVLPDRKTLTVKPIERSKAKTRPRVNVDLDENKNENDWL